MRCIVPGHAGARNCKYLEMVRHLVRARASHWVAVPEASRPRRANTQVTVTDCPCAGNCNWKQYAVHAPDVPTRKVRSMRGAPPYTPREWSTSDERDGVGGVGAQIADFEMHHEELMMDPAVQVTPSSRRVTPD
eukprot:COSAG01_NODE_18405_length_1078_cov_0.979571_2_plen_134_part_00